MVGFLIELDYWYVSHSKKHHYSIVIAQLFCIKLKPFLTLSFVNIDLELDWLMQSYFD